MLGRYLIDFSKEEKPCVSLQRGTSPIIHISVQGEYSFEIGVNIAHKKQDVAYFSELKTDTEALCTEQIRLHILRELPNIILGDPCFSTFSFAGASVFSLHVSDLSFQALLEKESQCMVRQELARRIQRDKYQVTEDMLEEITKNPGIYLVLLSLMDEQERNEYHTKLLYDARRKKRDYLQAKNARLLLKEIAGLESKLRVEGVYSGIGKVVKETQKRLAKNYRPITEERLEALFEKFPKEGIETENPLTADLYESIEVTRTSLHQRTNPGYAENIRSYKCREARTLVEKRRRIIRGANMLDRKEGREFISQAKEELRH